MSGKISILFPCYNQRDFIAQGIRSCFYQDYENIEVVVLDDGSSDDSLQVISDIAVSCRLHDDSISKDPEKMWIRFSELRNVLSFQSRRQASFSAYATYMTAVRKSGKWYHKDILKRIFPTVLSSNILHSVRSDAISFFHGAGNAGTV
jgi:cellulose synthase/poly-beta-1,6-N-acetylglucosamine synthase-like glycosyltransferase